MSTNSLERQAMVHKSLLFLVAQDIVKVALVIWHDPTKPSPPTSIINGKCILFLHNEINSLNNRFRPSLHILTDAVLVLDDDIFVAPDNLALLFRTWVLFHDSIVGFFPRWITTDHMYLARNEDSSHGGYHMMLTKVMLLHRSYLFEFSCGTGRIFHKFVDNLMNCEDIAMNFLVAGMRKGPSAFYVQPLRRIGDYGRSLPGSLFKRGSHGDDRSHCIQQFENVTGNFLPGQTKAAFGTRVGTGDIQVHLNSSYVGVFKHNSYCLATEETDGCDL
ncbi:exostosin [Dunaliella salina]|uniref:Exostosin n=1 Tax=Dunaliella salina TaxID=3046 RepID=A0ABQ7FXV3_DUNSA|nr:exostosin [Dunaliella salina]|eukprot:KAF5827190.1 exostosin [Dunaliella salina]